MSGKWQKVKFLAISSLDDKSSAYCADIRNLFDSGLPQNRRENYGKMGMSGMWLCI